MLVKGVLGNVYTYVLNISYGNKSMEAYYITNSYTILFTNII